MRVIFYFAAGWLSYMLWLYQRTTIFVTSEP